MARSINISIFSDVETFLNGRYAGCQRLPGVNNGIEGFLLIEWRNYNWIESLNYRNDLFLLILNYSKLRL